MITHEKTDRKFIQELLFSLYTLTEIADRSVTGALSKNPNQSQTKKKPITPTKLQFIYGKYLLKIVFFNKIINLSDTFF